MAQWFAEDTPAGGDLGDLAGGAKSKKKSYPAIMLSTLGNENMFVLNSKGYSTKCKQESDGSQRCTRRPHSRHSARYKLLKIPRRTKTELSSYQSFVKSEFKKKQKEKVGFKEVGNKWREMSDEKKSQIQKAEATEALRRPQSVLIVNSAHFTIPLDPKKSTNEELVLTVGVHRFVLKIDVTNTSFVATMYVTDEKRGNDKNQYEIEVLRLEKPFPDLEKAYGSLEGDEIQSLTHILPELVKRKSINFTDNDIENSMKVRKGREKVIRKFARVFTKSGFPISNIKELASAYKWVRRPSPASSAQDRERDALKYQRLFDAGLLGKVDMVFHNMYMCELGHRSQNLRKMATVGPQPIVLMQVVLHPTEIQLRIQPQVKHSKRRGALPPLVDNENKKDFITRLREKYLEGTPSPPVKTNSTPQVEKKKKSAQKLETSAIRSTQGDFKNKMRTLYDAWDDKDFHQFAFGSQEMKDQNKLGVINTKLNRILPGVQIRVSDKSEAALDSIFKRLCTKNGESPWYDEEQYSIDTLTKFKATYMDDGQAKHVIFLAEKGPDVVGLLVMKRLTRAELMEKHLNDDGMIMKHSIELNKKIKKNKNSIGVSIEVLCAGGGIRNLGKYLMSVGKLYADYVENNELTVLEAIANKTQTDDNKLLEYYSTFANVVGFHLSPGSKLYDSAALTQ